MRYFLELEYFGKAYHGWQRQPNALSVQETVEDKLSILFQKEITVLGAGRTDAGVHARQFFAHVDVEKNLNLDFIFKLNSLLPQDIAAKRILPVKPDAHARFDAISRSYEYHITETKNVFEINSAYLVHRHLNVDKMNEAAKILLQYENFKCFSRSRTDVFTYNCQIKKAEWQRNEEKLIFFISANRFLRNMVRAIVGTLLEIGLEKIPVQQMHQIIKSENRKNAGASVPAHALYLTQVNYPKSLFI